MVLPEGRRKKRYKSGLEIKLNVFCIENSTSLGSLQKFEGAAGEFKGALSSWHPLISSPASERLHGANIC